MGKKAVLNILAVSNFSSQTGRNVSDASTREWIFLAGLCYQDFNNCGKYVFRTKIRGFACVCRTAPEYSELQTSAFKSMWFSLGKMQL